MIRGCPGCGSKDLRPSQAESPLESAKSIFGFGPVRCRGCDLRFCETALWSPLIRHAWCPKCFREDLNDWAEKYFYPPWYKRLLIYVGAKKHRCSRCRYNFVSFLPRKATNSKLSDTVKSEL